MRRKSKYSNLDLESINYYLSANQWKVVTEDSTSKIMQKKYESEVVELRVPIEQYDVNYLQQISGLVQNLSELNKTSGEEIIRGIKSCKNDLFYARVLPSIEGDDYIPLEETAQHIEALKSLFFHTALHVVNPSHKNLNTVSHKAMRYANECHYSNMFPRNIDFTVQSPIKTSKESSKEEDPLFSRKVMQTLIHGLHLLKEASVQENLENFESGLNINMCDALLNLNLYGQKDVVLFIDWGLRIAIEEPTYQKFSLLLNQEMTEKVQQVKDGLEQMICSESVTLTEAINFSFEEPEISPTEYKYVIFAIQEPAVIKAVFPISEWERIEILLSEKKPIELVGDFIKLPDHWRLVKLNSIK